MIINVIVCKGYPTRVVPVSPVYSGQMDWLCAVKTCMNLKGDRYDVIGQGWSRAGFTWSSYPSVIYL